MAPEKSAVRTGSPFRSCEILLYTSPVTSSAAIPDPISKQIPSYEGLVQAQCSPRHQPKDRPEDHGGRGDDAMESRRGLLREQFEDLVHADGIGAQPSPDR
jgi:hypothetical protein